MNKKQSSKQGDSVYPSDSASGKKMQPKKKIWRKRRVFAQPLGACTRPLVLSICGAKVAQESQLFLNWTEIVGQSFADLCSPKTLGGGFSGGQTGLLTLETRPAYAQEVTHRQKDLIDRINLFFGATVVSRLRLVPYGRDKRNKQAAQPVSSPALSSGLSVQKAFIRPVEGIEDQDLARALALFKKGLKD